MVVGTVVVVRSLQCSPLSHTLASPSFFLFLILVDRGGGLQLDARMLVVHPRPQPSLLSSLVACFRDRRHWVEVETPLAMFSCEPE